MMFNRTLKTLELNYEGFEQYLLTSSIIEKYESAHYIFKFDNGIGASVIKHIGSYGYDQDLWELATIKFDENGDWELVYNSTFAPDVLGWLEEDQVRKLLEEIKNLPKDAPFSE